MTRATASIVSLVAILFLLAASFTLTPQTTTAQSGIKGDWTTIANGDDVRGLAMTFNIVWAGTHGGGVVQWDPSDGTHTQYLANETGLLSNNVQAVASDGQYLLWFATDRGVSQFEPGASEWEQYTAATDNGLPSNNATAVAFGPDGKVWIGTSQVWDGDAWTGGGLSVCALGGDCVTYTVENSELPSNNITSIAFAGNDVWIGTRPYKVFVEATNTTPAHWEDRGGGAARLAAGEWQVFSRTQPGEGLPNNLINAVATSSDGRVWFATPAGLAVYDPAEDTWQTYNTADGLESTAVRDVTVDNEGRVWALTYLNETSPIGALNVLIGEDWTEYGVDDGLTSPILWAVLADSDGRIWVGTRPWCRNQVGCEGGGITRHDPLGNDWRAYRMSDNYLISNHVTDVAVTDDGALWIGTWGSGISVREADGEWRTLTVDNSDLVSNRVRALTVGDDGTVWIGTLRYVEEGAWVGGGLNAYSDGDWTTYDIDNGLPANMVSDIEIDADGVVWVATGDVLEGGGGGVATFDSESDEWLATHTTENGLPSNVVTDVGLDPTGDRVWVATAPAGGYLGGGLAVFEGGVWTSHTTPDVPSWSSGERTGDFRVVVVDEDGDAWAGTYDTQGVLSDRWPYVDALVVRQQNGEWTEMSFAEQGFISSLLWGNDGTLWAGISHASITTQLSPEQVHLQSSRGGLRARIDGNWFAATAASSGLAGSDVTALTLDANGDLWVATANAGLSLLEGAQPGPTPTNTVPPTDTPSPTDTPGPTETPRPPGPGPTATETPIPVTLTPGDISPPAEIPEAATLILVGTGLAGLGGYAAYRWRARNGG